jgi:hypothetical protein
VLEKLRGTPLAAAARPTEQEFADVIQQTVISRKEAAEQLTKLVDGRFGGGDVMTTSVYRSPTC